MCVYIYIYIYIQKYSFYGLRVCLYMCVCVSIYILLTPATMYTFLWSAWVIYRVLKFQIRKEIKGPQSEEEKSDLSTN